MVQGCPMSRPGTQAGAHLVQIKICVRCSSKQQPNCHSLKPVFGKPRPAFIQTAAQLPSIDIRAFIPRPLALAALDVLERLPHKSHTGTSLLAVLRCKRKRGRGHACGEWRPVMHAFIGNCDKVWRPVMHPAPMMHPPMEA
eukprot:scaffold121804_cov18-Tisochrysis_lutea.AAC.1